MRTSSAGHPHTCMPSTRCPQAVCITPHDQYWPELSFTVTGICYLVEYVAGIWELFHFRIMEMISEIICVDGFLCMSHLDIVDILSRYVYVICILSGHMCIMRILSAIVLDMFLRNRQYRCDPYIISSNFYRSYHISFIFCILFTQTHIVNAIYILYM